MLKLYTLFHLNLMYSSIEEEDRAEVIEKCYWPLLHLVSDQKVPLGIELSGYTLEEINRIDPQWVDLFKELIQKKQIELIGSGYSQLIGPIVPDKVNDWNQKIGVQTYQKLLKDRPKIALINEMAYSAGILSHYARHGYGAVVMEWNNPRATHQQWPKEWNFAPQKVVTPEGKKMALIWADSIAFQKFQRTIHGEISLKEYLTYLYGYQSSKERYFPLYVNDAEVFNYRPKRYLTEAKLKQRNEFQRMKKLFQELQNNPKTELVFPSQVLKGTRLPHGGHQVVLESAEQPISVKKQEKYNMNRWTLTGRGDLEINSACYRLYSLFLKNKKVSKEDWKALCFLWSSDIRTHITSKRWDRYSKKLKSYLNKFRVKKLKQKKSSFKPVSLPYSSGKCAVTKEENLLVLESSFISIVLDTLKGNTLTLAVFNKLGRKPLFGLLPHGYFEDISYGADFFSGHSIVEYPGKHKITDLGAVKPKVFFNSKEKTFLVESVLKQKAASFKNKIKLKTNEILFQKQIKLSSRQVGTIHPFQFTFIPEAWDLNSLFFATHNGGKRVELFYLKEREVAHGASLSSLISAKHGLGATEGVVIIGDKDKYLCFEHDPSEAAMVPTLFFKKTRDRKVFFRLQYSAQEMDETFIASKKPQKLSCSLKISGGKGLFDKC